MNESKKFRNTVIGLITFWLIAFVFFPNILIFVVSFLKRDTSSLIVLEFTLQNYLNLTDPIYLKVLVRSALLAWKTTWLCVLVAFPFALFLSTVRKSVKGLLLLLVMVPFWTSALIRTYAINMLIARKGIINGFLMGIGVIEEPLRMLYTEGAIVAGLVYTLLPFMILPMYSVIDKLDKRYIEAASDLGAGKFSILLRIIIPLTAPGIIAGSLLVFLPALGLYYIPDLLGGSMHMLVGNLIKAQFLEFRNWPFGAAVSTVLTMMMGILLVVNYKLFMNNGKKGGNG